MNNQQLNSDSSKDEIRSASEAMFGLLADYFFDKVNFLNNPGLSTSASTTSTTTYDVAVRVPDTSLGKYFKIDRRSRLRTVFYITGGAENAEAYILSPCLYPSTSSISSGIASLDVFNFYTGIKINKGSVSLVSSVPGKKRKTSTSKVLRSNTTYKLDMLYSGTKTDVYIDDEFIGSVSNSYNESLGRIITTYPLIAPIRSATGSAVEITLENYQILQDK